MTHAEDALYRRLLGLLPVSARTEFGADMAQLFRDRRRQVAGRPLAIGRLWMAAVADLVIQAWRMRQAERREAVTLTRPAFSSNAESGWLGRQTAALQHDVRVGLRMMVRDRAFTAIAVLVLAIGIGANSAAFTLVDVLLLKPGPGRPAGALLGLYNKDTSTPDNYRAFSYPEFEQIRARTDLFAAAAAHNFAFVGVADGDHSRQVIVDMATRDFFTVFGVSLARGRTFSPAEERPGAAADVAILSYPAWLRRGGQDAILGSSVRVNGRPMTVIGVAARGFGGSLSLLTPELWVPISAYDRLANDFVREGQATLLADRRTRMLILDVQLRPALTAAQAGPALQALSAELVAADPTIAHSQLILSPLSRMSVSTSPQNDSALTEVMAAILGLSSIVLLIASLNLANMLLSRGVARRKEFAVRLAIGGSRGRVVRQLLTEGLLLAVVGAGLGLLLAEVSTQALVARLTPFIPLSLDLDAAPDARIIGATIAFSVLAALVFSVGPAWALSKTDSVSELRTHGSEGGRARLRTRHLLVGGQLALSVIMLTSAGLFVRTATETARLNPGFPMDRGLIAQVDASLAGSTPPQTTATYRALLDRLRARPDVASASLTSSFPFTGFSDDRAVRPLGTAPRDPHEAEAELVMTDADYFRTVGLPLLRGRAFAFDTLGDGSRHEAVIDVTLAHHLFGTADPIGQPIVYDVAKSAPPVRLDVIGLVPGVGGLDGRDADATAHLYLPYANDPRASVYVLVRTRLTPSAEAALLPELRETFRAVRADLPILSLETLSMFRDRSIELALERTGARLFGAFGLAALFLAAIGIYGVKAYVVTRRTREIGIRIALGATRQSVLWLIAREGLTVAVSAVALGTGVSVLTVWLLRNSLGDMSYLSSALVAAIAILVATAVLAGLVPARRATRIQPVVALRTE